jgi:hypothetical protein
MAIGVGHYPVALLGVPIHRIGGVVDACARL